jgi:hypothetical protein
MTWPKHVPLNGATSYNTNECKSKCVEIYAFILNISNNLACELIFNQKRFHLFFNVALKVFGASNNLTITSKAPNHY